MMIRVYRPNCAISLAVLGLLLGQTSISTANTPSEPFTGNTYELLNDVRERQKVFARQREDFTYKSNRTVEELDGKGTLIKMESREVVVSFANGHLITRVTKINGRPISDLQAGIEDKRVNQEISKSEKPEDGLFELETIVNHIEIVNSRRVAYRGRPTIACDFIGHKKVKTGDPNDELAKKLKGTIWIDEADKAVAHMDVTLVGDYATDRGLVRIRRGSNFHFEQLRASDGVWLSNSVEAQIQISLLFVKSFRQHITERDFDYRRYQIETEHSERPNLPTDRH